MNNPDKQRPKHRIAADIELTFEENAREHPRWADVQNRWGLVLLTQGRVEEALAVFDQCLQINPKYGWAAMNRVQALALTGDMESAQAALKDISEPAPGMHAWASAFLALLGAGEDRLHGLDGLHVKLRSRPDMMRLQAALIRASDPQRADAIWAEVANDFPGVDSDSLRPWDETGAVEPRLVTFVAGLHDLYREASTLAARLGRMPEALTLASLMRFHWANDAFYFTQCGYLAAFAGDDEKAETLYEEAIRLDPNCTQAHIALAYACSAMGKLDRALDAVDNALASAPRYADLHYQRGLLLQAHSQLQDSLDSFQRAVSINPRYSMARMQEATLLFQMEEWTEARESFQEVLDCGLRSTDIYLYLGQIESRLGNLGNAEKAYFHARRLNPLEPFVYYLLGKLYRQLGDKKKAKDAWKRFLELPGEAEHVAEVKTALGSDCS